MKIARSTYFGLGLVALAFLASAVVYPWLPDPMPTHWNLRGEANGFTAKPLGPFLLPLVMLLVLGLRLGRWRAAAGRAGGAIAATLLLALGTLHIAALVAALGYPVSFVFWGELAVGVLFIVVGNFMGKVERNLWVGLRTPWTLGSDEVWLRSNRFAGRLMMLGGLMILAGCALGAGPWLLLVVAAPVAIAPIVHSYVAARRLRGDQSQPT